MQTVSKHALFIAMAACLALPTLVLAAESAQKDKPSTAKLCLNCHKAEANNLKGHWESVAMKSSSVQMRIDDRSEVLKFDKATVKVSNTSEKGDTEKMLRSIKKGHEVRIEYSEKDGVKYASAIVAKPPVKLSEKDKIELAAVEKLVAMGPEKGHYTLIDSRPGSKFKEGTIPTAISLPYPEFDKLTDRLPADKNRLIIFFCSGESCNMSPGSQKKAKTLGYTNIKVFVQGMPAWMGKNYGVLSAQSLKDAYKDMPTVILDTRAAAAAEKGFIKGAIAFQSVDEKTLKALPKKELKAPVIVYDADGKGNAASIARGIIKSGYGNILMLSDGFAGWEKAALPVESGKLAIKASYVPKPKQGEFPSDQFEKIMGAIPADTIILDVRNAEEVAENKIVGAINIPAEDLDARFAELPKDKRIIAFCNTGTRAEMAYLTLKAKGFTQVYFLNAKVDFDDGKPEILKY